MDQRDQEFLDKQLRRLRPSLRSDGVLALSLVTVFLGGLIFAQDSARMQIVSSYDAKTTISLPNRVPPRVF